MLTGGDGKVQRRRREEGKGAEESTLVTGWSSESRKRKIVRRARSKWRRRGR